MHNTNIPIDRELPSAKKLLKSTILAATTAAVLLVTVVMPAEYGIDPTGIGKIMGLTSMGKIKMGLAEESARQKPATEVAVPVQQAAPLSAAVQQRSDEMKVTLAPGQSTEIKVTLLKGEKVNYKWFSSGGKVQFDNHGDSAQANVNYHGYGKGTKASDEGVIEAAFNGQHGWYWKNRGSESLTITLQTTGAYTEIKHLK
jgi:hypothetical protein